VAVQADLPDLDGLSAAQHVEAMLVGLVATVDEENARQIVQSKTLAKVCALTLKGVPEV
jgi:hypothetical protein